MIAKYIASIYSSSQTGGEFDVKTGSRALVTKWSCSKKTAGPKIQGGKGGIEIKGEVQYQGFKTKLIERGMELEVGGATYLIKDVDKDHPNLMTLICEVI